MKSTGRWLVAGVLLLGGVPPGAGQTPEAAPPPVLTLAEAVQQALLRNDRLIDARDSLDQADLSVRLARSAFHPKLVPNVLGSFGQTDVADQTYRMDLTQRLTTGTQLRASVGSATSRDQLGNFYTTDTTLEVSQPLLRGFGRSARRGLTSAELRLADAGRQRRLAEQQVVVEMATVYYRVVAQKRLVDAAEKSLERSRDLLEASQAKLAVGRVSQLDVDRAQQLAAQAETQLLDAQDAVADGMDQIRTLLGRGPDYVFELPAELPEQPEEPLPGPEEAVRTALEHRLDLQTALDAAADADRAASYARNQLLPQVDVNFALTRRETASSFSSSFKFNDFRFATFFTISLPQDRTAQRIEYNNALIERDRRKREMESLKRRIDQEARRAVRQEQRLARSLQVADTSVEFAQQELEVARLRYQRGLSNNLDVVNAEAGLLSAHARRFMLRAEAAAARLAARATLGILDPRKDL